MTDSRLTNGIDTGRVSKGFDLATQGKDPPVDALVMITAILGELTDTERRRVWNYVDSMLKDDEMPI